MAIAVEKSIAILTGKTIVETAGTAVQLTTGRSNRWGRQAGINNGVSVNALSTNTGVIYVGDADVSSEIGYQLAASEAITIATPDINDVWIDAQVDGEGVTWLGT